MHSGLNHECISVRTASVHHIINKSSRINFQGVTLLIDLSLINVPPDRSLHLVDHCMTQSETRYFDGGGGGTSTARGCSCCCYFY